MIPVYHTLVYGERTLILKYRHTLATANTYRFWMLEFGRWEGVGACPEPALTYGNNNAKRSSPDLS